MATLEVLAFDYFSFIRNNLWTWIVVVTATVSFWRIRANTKGNYVRLMDDSPHEPPKSQATSAVVVETRHHVTARETKAWSPLLCNDGVTKGKLTVYYKEKIDGDTITNNDDEELMTVAHDLSRESGNWWENWERVVRMRNGDEGLYRYVDLKVINGSVVRLWDANGVRNSGWVSMPRKEFYGRDIFGKF